MSIHNPSIKLSRDEASIYDNYEAGDQPLTNAGLLEKIFGQKCRQITLSDERTEVWLKVNGDIKKLKIAKVSMRCLLLPGFLITMSLEDFCAELQNPIYLEESAIDAIEPLIASLVYPNPKRVRKIPENFEKSIVMDTNDFFRRVGWIGFQDQRDQYIAEQ